MRERIWCFPPYLLGLAFGKSEASPSMMLSPLIEASVHLPMPSRLIQSSLIPPPFRWRDWVLRGIQSVWLHFKIASLPLLFPESIARIPFPPFDCIPSSHRQYSLDHSHQKRRIRPEKVTRVKQGRKRVQSRDRCNEARTELWLRDTLLEDELNQSKIEPPSLESTSKAVLWRTDCYHSISTSEPSLVEPSLVLCLVLLLTKADTFCTFERIAFSNSVEETIPNELKEERREDVLGRDRFLLFTLPRR